MFRTTTCKFQLHQGQVEDMVIDLSSTTLKLETVEVSVAAIQTASTVVRAVVARAQDAGPRKI